MTNIYDNEEFFKGYLAIRENPYSANDVVETPVLFSMLPGVEGKRVLDLGCGFGASCKMVADMGASEVIGIDSSQKMLAIAKRENSHERITYLNSDLEHLECMVSQLGEFDVVMSSLAMHYIEDFSELVHCVYRLLVPGGAFVFSQEHPIFTAPRQTANWITEEGNTTGFVLKDYPDSGYRRVFWIVNGFEKFHRTFSDIVNALIRAGFILNEVGEPIPSESDILADRQLSRCRHVPDYLFIRALKPSDAY